MIRENVTTGSMAGSVTALILARGPAPSIFAASYSSGFTPVSAAKYKMVAQPVSFQICEPTSSGTKALVEVMNSVLLPPAAKRRLLINPFPEKKAYTIP